VADITEPIRRHAVAAINSEVESNDKDLERKRLEGKYGKVWSTEELTKEFTVEAFLAPYVLVLNKETMKDGVMEFQHMPRFYFNHKER